MASSLIKHKRITTTLAKAKALRKYAEPLITKSKNDTTHSRRSVFSYLKDKDAVTILFREVSDKVANRPGGYTRIIKLENRAGDNAEMAIIELVDYNEVYTKGGDAKVEKKATRRRGGSGKKAAAAPAEVVEAPEAEVAEAVEVADAAAEEVTEAVEATESEEVAAEVAEATEEAPAADEADQAEEGTEKDA